LREGLPVAALVYLVAVALAYGCLKFYDEPVRKWLRKKVSGDGVEVRVIQKPVSVD
jgi:peptidoglycan/LPS O-acetylase OafA/YrhL